MENGTVTQNDRRYSHSKLVNYFSNYSFSYFEEDLKLVFNAFL